MRGQVGIEIMGVVGFVMLILIPLFAGFYAYSNQFWEQLAIEKADIAATQLARAADMVGTQGDAMLVQEIVIPENVVEIRTDGKEIVFSLSTSSGPTDIVKGTSHDVQGSLGALKKGSYYILAESERGLVTLELR